MYFIALVAPPEINEPIVQWKIFMEKNYGCRVALRSPAHITLIPPFWMKEELENEIKKTIFEFLQNESSFEIQLRDFNYFKPRVIFVDVEKNEKLSILQKKLAEFIASKKLFPVKPDERPFHPHLTIATRDLYKKAFYEAWEIFKTKKYNAVWQVNGISLLKHDQKNWEVIFTSPFRIKKD